MPRRHDAPSVSDAPRGRALALACLVVAVACSTPTQPLPDAAIRFQPDPSIYPALWREVEACAERTSRYESVTWYLVPGAETITLGGRDVWGYWSSSTNRIVLTQGATVHANVVRHEMLHAILHAEGHPDEFFRHRCGGVV
jgi:hypothetical protein